MNNMAGSERSPASTAGNLDAPANIPIDKDHLPA